jgi:predicted ArsR family transcriptional regulator
VLPHIHGASLGERVRAAAEALAEEGLGFDIEADGAGYLLAGHGCPCPRLTERGSQVCAHDQRLLSLLLGADVSCVEPEAAGQAAGCSYRVRERRMAKASLPASRSAV